VRCRSLRCLVCFHAWFDVFHARIVEIFCFILTLYLCSKENNKCVMRINATGRQSAIDRQSARCSPQWRTSANDQVVYGRRQDDAERRQRDSRLHGQLQQMTVRSGVPLVASWMSLLHTDRSSTSADVTSVRHSAGGHRTDRTWLIVGCYKHCIVCTLLKITGRSKPLFTFVMKTVHTLSARVHPYIFWSDENSHAVSRLPGLAKTMSNQS